MEASVIFHVARPLTRAGRDLSIPALHSSADGRMKKSLCYQSGFRWGDADAIYYLATRFQLSIKIIANYIFCNAVKKKERNFFISFHTIAWIVPVYENFLIIEIASLLGILHNVFNMAICILIFLLLNILFLWFWGTSVKSDRVSR